MRCVWDTSSMPLQWGSGGFPAEERHCSTAGTDLFQRWNVYLPLVGK